MTTTLDRLVELLALERLEENRFLGQSQDLGWGAIFGGQVLGQALSAAEQTVPAERACHSMHAYFLRPGDVCKPVTYDVERVQDGWSFCVRRVVALQDRKVIFQAQASFQVAEEGFEHQSSMPEVAGPEGLASERELALARMDRIPEFLRGMALAERPIEIRIVHPVDPLHPEPLPPVRHAWCRADGKLPDSPALHRRLLAYTSDFHLLGAALQPHGISWLTPGMKMASLDHAIWFHRSFRMDDWLLYAIDSPSASHARGLSRGHFFNRQGQLVASTAQEGLIRQRS